MSALLLASLTSLAWGQDYAFPTSPDDRVHWYPTAYKDHAGTDWNCGSITYSGHRGSDFGGGSFAGMDEGRDVVAAAPGTVIATNDGEFDRCTTSDCAGGSGFGNFVHIAHSDGRTTLYGHLKQFSVSVAVGDDVSCGQLLGEMGSSGYSSGPHLHFEVRGASGVAEDPFDGPCSGPPTYWTDQGVYGELPGDVCAEAAVCLPEQLLTCGDVVTGDSDGPTSTQATWRYGCDEFVYSGPERSFTVQTDRDEPVTVRLEGLAADLDLMALVSEACAGDDCIVGSSNPNTTDELLVVDADADVPFTVVLDGWEGAVSPFVLTVDCDGGLGTPIDTGEGTAKDTAVVPTVDTGREPTAPTGSGTTTDPTDDAVGTLPGNRDVPPLEKAGCGCSSAWGAPHGAWLAALLVAVRRRSHA